MKTLFIRFLFILIAFCSCDSYSNRKYPKDFIKAILTQPENMDSIFRNSNYIKTDIYLTDVLQGQKPSTVLKKYFTKYSKEYFITNEYVYEENNIKYLAIEIAETNKKADFIFTINDKGDWVFVNIRFHDLDIK